MGKVRNSGAKRYYIADIYDSYLNLEDIYENIDNYLNMSLSELNNLGLSYIVEYSDIEYEASILSTDITNKGVLKYKKLADVIFDYLEPYGLYELYQDDDSIDEILLDEMDIFMDKYLIIRENRKTKTYSVVRLQDINYCFIQLLDNISNEFIERLDSIQEIMKKTKLNGFESKFLELTNKIESFLENEKDTVIIILDDLSTSFFVFRKGTTALKNYKRENKDIKLDKPNKNGIIYECGYTIFLDYVKSNLMINSTNTIPIILSCKVPNQNMYKKYAFILIRDEYNNTMLVQLTAQEVCDIHTEVNKEDIYCGSDGNDIICGFDLL